LRVAVIGGAGRMGRWFIEYLLRQGHIVVFSDIRNEEARTVAKLTGAALAKDNLEAVGEADLAVVCTPIEVTPEVLREILTARCKPATIMEICSVKSHVIPVLEEAVALGLSTLSVHPLFGPGASKTAREKVALVPISNPALELEHARNVFPDAEIVVVDAEEHDKAMALTLSLVHFVNIALASVIGEEDLNVLKKLGGTTFALQLLLSEAVMTEDPELCASIQMSNTHTTQYLKKFLSRAEILKQYVVENDTGSFCQLCEDIRAAFSKDEDFAEAYERMYRALEAFRNRSARLSSP